jgi:hypothetical protein
MAPNAKAQELVAHQALRQAKIDPATIDYVEARKLFWRHLKLGGVGNDD